MKPNFSSFPLGQMKETQFCTRERWVTKLGNSALQYQRDTSVSRQNQPPLQISSTGLLALSYARCILKTCCSNNIRAIIEIRDLCKARHLPLPREPSQKNATRPDKPFNRYLGGMEGGATKFPTNVIGTKLHQRCLPQVCMDACMQLDFSKELATHFKK